MVTPGTFRAQFPEFGDPQRYPDVQINLWLTVAPLLLNANRWGDLLDFGTSLFVAHHVALSKRNKAIADAGGIPGEVKGPPTAKNAESVGGSYDSRAVTLEDGGFWNLTTYGVEFLQYSRLIGTGGLQVAGPLPPEAFFFWGGNL